MVLPAFIRNLPAFVKTTGGSLLPALAHNLVQGSREVTSAVLVINRFAKLSYFTERHGLSDRFFMLLLSLSMCFSCILFLSLVSFVFSLSLFLPPLSYLHVLDHLSSMTAEDRSSECDSRSKDRKILEELSRKICIFSVCFVLCVMT